VAVPLASAPHTDAEQRSSACPHGHGHGGATFAPLIRRAWAEKRWRQEDPRTTDQRRRLRHHRECPHTRSTRAYFRKASQRQRRQFEAHRKAKLEAREQRRALTPYDCGSAGRFAIPCSVVACESGYSWSAYNPSGAAGAYQIMPEHGRPWPVDSREDKLAHHRIAASLWAGGSGSGNWVCAS
jgi:hypothetical protein